MFEYALLPIEQQTGLQKLDDIHELLFEQISFAFAGRSKLFKNIYLNVKKGELIAILGKSGSGKSTILQLIQKAYLYDGSIRINGIDLRDIGMNEVRLHVASVPQEPRVFNGSLVFNICLSDSKEDNKRAVEFCQLNGMDKFFQAFPQAYDTVLGEEGIAISGGQKQLVVLARAIFRNPTLLLLDEPTSAMDPVTEDFIINLLHQLRTTMLIVMVTHRSSAAQRCDRIYELSSGTMKPVTRRKH